jgi:hypothetical protein
VLRVTSTATQTRAGNISLWALQVVLAAVVAWHRRHSTAALGDR